MSTGSAVTPPGGTVYVKPVSTTDESVSIDDSTDGTDLREVHLVPVDEAEDDERSSQAYVHECPDGGGAHMAITLSNHPDEPIDLVRRRYGMAAGPERRRTPATVGGQL